jgi:hypothetical protein
MGTLLNSLVNHQSAQSTTGSVPIIIIVFIFRFLVVIPVVLLVIPIFLPILLLFLVLIPFDLLPLVV